MYSTTTNPISKMLVSEISGKIDQIKPNLHGTQFVLKDVKINLGKHRNLKKVKINVASKLLEWVDYGDTVHLKAKLFPLQKSILPDTYDFGFYMYMSGIEANGYALTSMKILEKRQNLFYEYIQNLRQKIYRRLIQVMGSDYGNFASAIMIGETKAIPRKIADNMRDSGVAHILSVSGLHLSLVAMIFFISSRILMNYSDYLAYNINIKLIAACISIIGSFLYLQISGCNIAAMRAFIMTVIFIIAIMLGRSTYPLRSLMIAAFLILVFSPEYLFHPSFQLSFVAVLCLMSGYEFYLRHKYILGGSKGVFASIKIYAFTNIYSSFIASIATAPFVVYHFYKFANYSILMNLLAVPLMSFFIMPLALLSTILMPISSDALLLKALGFFISLIINVADYMVLLPGAIWLVGHITSFSLVLFTFGLFWFCIWQSNWRFAGVIIMGFSIILMLTHKKPDVIYDNNIKMLGVKTAGNKLEVYAQDKIPEFTLNYWASWYGQKELKLNKKKIKQADQMFILASGKSISLDYWECSNADISIITSRKLKCDKKRAGHTISNADIWKHKQVMLYDIDDAEKFYVKYP